MTPNPIEHFLELLLECFEKVGELSKGSDCHLTESTWC